MFRENLTMKLKRTLLSAATCLLLSSCGGGDMLTAGIGGGGIGGTGISMGTIAGFGSIWVNGVRYDVSNASFTRDGASVSGQGDYRIGEVVTITGSVNADGVSGVANSVEYDDSLEGTVSAASTDGETLSVLGVTVRVDALTLLHGFNALTDLQAGNVVEISGYKQQDTIRATSIILKQATFTDNQSTIEIKGTVSDVDLIAKTFKLGTLVVDYASASLSMPNNLVTAGQFVEVKSRQAPQGNRLIASEVELKDEYPNYNNGQEVELEGLVTSFSSILQFSVNGQPTTTNASTTYEYGLASDVQLNSLVEVKGTINSNGVLLAEEVSLKQGNQSDSLEIEGRITTIDLAAMTLMVNGVTISVDNHTSLFDEINDRYVTIQVSDLRINDYVEVDSSLLSDGRTLALKIERESP